VLFFDDVVEAPYAIIEVVVWLIQSHTIANKSGIMSHTLLEPK
jgi:hypothetical protein